MNKQDLLFMKDYYTWKWIVIKQHRYDDDDYTVVKTFDTMQECQDYIDSFSNET